MKSGNQRILTQAESLHDGLPSPFDRAEAVAFGSRFQLKRLAET